MSAWLAKLSLLLDGAWRLAASRVVDVQWTFLSGAQALLWAGLPLALLLAVLCYSRTTEGLTRRNRVLLAALRFTALLCLLLMLSGAAATVLLRPAAKPELLVVLDDSASMTLAETGRSRLQSAEAVLGQGGLLARLRKEFHVRQVRTSGANTAPSADGPQDPARALIRLATAPTDRPLDQILFISDGIATGPDALARAAAELPAPVSTLLAGTPAAVRDVILDSVIVPPYAYAKDRTVIGALVRSCGIKGEAALKLYQVRGSGEKEIAATHIPLNEDGRPAVARLEFQAGEPGLQSYVLRVLPSPQELTEANNDLRFHLDVRGERIHVLFVEGEPSWEYRYVKEALEGDPAVLFHGLVRLPDGQWFYQGPAMRADGKPVLRNPGAGFPIPGDEWNSFDVLILGDLDRKEFERGDGFGLLDAFVRVRGAGLITIGGMKVYGAGDYENTALARLVPFEVEREKKQQLVNRFNARVTGEGLMHPVTQLEADPEANRKAWEALPWVEGGNAITRVKPGATCLLVHPTLQTKYGARPVLAAWQAGAGRVLASALDGTWHWRLAGKSDTDYHQRFWGLAVRWAAGDLRQRQPLGVLTFEDAVTESGKPLRVSLNLSDGEGHPQMDAGVEFAFGTPATGGVLLVRAAVDPNVPGRYAATIIPARAGDLAVKVTVTTQAGQTQTHEASCFVAPSRREFEQVVPDADALQALAQATGGKYASLDTVSALSLPGKGGGTGRAVVLVELWRAPGVALILAACLCLEWFLRKRRGLS